VCVLHNHRVVGWLERVVLALSLIYLCMHTLPRAWKTLNTDFPNYYMAARMAHEGYDTSRMYEWPWIEREKDHRAVDIRVIGLLPITPFSTLAVWPITGLAPLAAKHVWILVNLALLVPIGWLLRAMTGLSYQRVALVMALCFPLHRNLSYGQFYILLLLLLVASCWAYLRGFRALAGALVAIAAACKIFPVLFFVFFLRRRDWRALTWGCFTGASAAASSITVFGWNVHRTYLHEVLPWTLHGEAMPPYIASASISGLLHRLLLSEPQWNPHPWHYSLLGYALLFPGLQMLVLAPAILLIRRDDGTRSRVLLEWSALLTASLSISTVQALYNFVLMSFPTCVVAAILLQRKQYKWLMALLIIYVGIGLPMPNGDKMIGPAMLLYVIRLPLMLAFLLGIYALLWRGLSPVAASRDWTRTVWVGGMALSLAVTAFSTYHREHAVRLEYAYRMPLESQGLRNESPRPAGAGVRYIAFTLSGYHLVTEGQNEPRAALPTKAPDDLSFANSYGKDLSGSIWVERALSPHSQIVDLRGNSHVVVDNAREPLLSADGQNLAYVRDDLGRGQLRLRRAIQSGAASDVALTPPRLDVYEASFVSEREYAFSAVERGHPPQIYLSDVTHENVPLELGESRYPALSPDGRWLAYSHLDHDGWNLWLRNQKTGTTWRLNDVPCNEIDSAWEDDSKTLLYSTDCGRSLWFTAIARRRVIP
jgi:Glycosyltransferase family 87/WD40-like Beta Propeller Repeat